MFVFSVVALAVVLAAAGVAVFAGHIPRLREWVGSAPLQAEEPTDVEAPR